MQFYTYPSGILPSLEHYILLSTEAPVILSREDEGKGLLLLDGTWKLAEKMRRGLPLSETILCRSLPATLKTAYPRRQEECHGLASVEALYAAYLLTGRNPEGLLDGYYWKEAFLEKNDFSIVQPCTRR